jgi:hypothetical protein
MRAWIQFSALLLLSTAQADSPRAWSYDSLRQGKSPNETAPAQTSGEQQVAALLAKMVDRWNAHDIEGYMENVLEFPRPELFLARRAGL